MERLDRLLQRNAAAWSAASSGWCVNPTGVGEIQAAGLDADRWSLWVQTHAPAQWAGADFKSHFSALPPGDLSSADHILWQMPREKVRQAMMGQALARGLSATGCLWVYGAKRAGIGSCCKALLKAFGSVEKVDSAGHGSLFLAREPLAEAFNPDGWVQVYDIEGPSSALTVHSLPGVFAHGKLDEGTGLLLEHLPTLTPGARVLDFGCGCGVIGLALLRATPGLALTFSDVSALALESTRRSLTANGLEGDVVASHGLASLDGSFDLVISNPPFHVGHREDATLSQRLLQDVGNFLAPGGSLLLVVNRHLRYRAWLEAGFRDSRVVASTSRFEVLLGRDPRIRISG